MDLLRLLEIDRSLIDPEARRSLLVAEIVWREEGCPRETHALVGALEKILRRCGDSGIWYAPVLLQRKKALERGTWRVPPQLAARLPQPPNAQARPGDSACAAVPGGSDSAASACEKCGGSGVVNAPGGFTRTLCPCGGYLRRLSGNDSFVMDPSKKNGQKIRGKEH